MGFWVDSISKLNNIPFIDNQDIFSVLLKSQEHELCNLSYYNVYSVIGDDYFFRFPIKHHDLGRIVHGLYFSWFKVSSIRCIQKTA